MDAIWWADHGFNRILNFANRNVDNVLIGRYISDAALGFYSLAYRMLLLPIQQINAPRHRVNDGTPTVRQSVDGDDVVALL